MSSIKVGDRVRVVLEAEVLETELEDLSGWIRLFDWNFIPPVGYGGVVSIELIPEPFVLPTKKYAQVISSDGVLFTLLATNAYDHSWKSEDGIWIRTVAMEAQTGMRIINEGVDE